jgi:hypothetical protein
VRPLPMPHLQDWRKMEVCLINFNKVEFDRLNPRASKFRGPPAKVYHIFTTVIGLSYLCCNSVLSFLNNYDKKVRTVIVNNPTNVNKADISSHLKSN